MLFFKNKKKELKKWHMYFLAIVILLAVAYRIYQSIWTKGVVIIAGRELKVLVADNPAHLYKGWSGRSSMGKFDGMLFVFGSRSQHAMVMRKMLFPLDIIWIDGDTIVDIAPNLTPEPGKREKELTPYLARLPSTFVLELPAGFTQKYGVKVGDEVQMNF